MTISKCDVIVADAILWRLMSAPFTAGPCKTQLLTERELRHSTGRLRFPDHLAAEYVEYFQSKKATAVHHERSAVIELTVEQGVTEFKQLSGSEL